MLYRASEFVHGLIGDMIYGSGNNSKGIEGVLAHFKYDCLDRYPRAYCTATITLHFLSILQQAIFLWFKIKILGKDQMMLHYLWLIFPSHCTKNEVSH